MKPAKGKRQVKAGVDASDKKCEQGRGEGERCNKTQIADKKKRE